MGQTMMLILQAFFAGVTEGIGFGVGLLILAGLIWKGYRHVASRFGNNG